MILLQILLQVSKRRRGKRLHNNSWSKKNNN
jgi:hypothetical protein